MMKLLCLTLLLCVLVNLISAIYIPSNKNFHLQEADNDGVLSLVNNVDDQDGSTKLITECGDDNDILTIDYIKLNPDPPVRGQTLTIDFKGTLKETVTEGAYVQVVVKYGLVTLIRKTFDLCEEVQKIDKKCPLEKGVIQITREVELPKTIPPGKYAVQAQVFTIDDEPITCLNGATTFPKL